MPPVLAVLFWTWVVVSLVVLVKRRALRRAERAEKAVEVDASGMAVAEPPEDLVAAMAGTPIPETTVETTTAPTPEPAAPVPAAVTPPTPPPGFETPVAPVIDRPAPRSAPAAGIADALVGIRMPCELVPLVFDRLATDRITLSTVGYPAEVVGRSLADEVERLGYVV